MGARAGAARRALSSARAQLAARSVRLRRETDGVDDPDRVRVLVLPEPPARLEHECAVLGEAELRTQHAGNVPERSAHWTGRIAVEIVPQHEEHRAIDEVEPAKHLELVQERTLPMARV